MTNTNSSIQDSNSDKSPARGSAPSNAKSGPGKRPTPDEAECVRLARIRLPGEGPRRTIAILRTSQESFVFRGDGQTRHEADLKLHASIEAFMWYYGSVT